METSRSTAPPKWKRVDGDCDPQPGGLNLTSVGMRRSCDACGRRKKKCDREWPCRRCRQAGDECTYSKRRWHLPHPQQPQRRQRPPQQQQPDPDRVHATRVLQHSSSSVLPGLRGVLSFKRYKLSASPATGLVGMQENSFLSNFFGCVGFLPLTTQSHIRETMVKIMLTPASRQHPSTRDDCGEAGQSGVCATGGAFGDTFGGDELPMGPSTCIFWCAVAVGALVKGCPIESVTTYSQRATEALGESRSGPADAEVARAWTILAYLYGFMADTARFQEYMTLSETFLTASIEQGSADKLPVGFAEIIRSREKVTTCDNMESVCSREQVVQQLTGGASEHELFRYVMQSFRVLGQAIYSKVLNRSPAGENPLGGAEPAGEGNGDQPHHAAPDPQEMSEAIATVMFQGNRTWFGLLGEAVERPSIRAGVGGVIIYGCLGFEAARSGDVCEALKRFSHCVEVFARYPGLCRSHWMGAHKAHTVLAALAALNICGAREQYDRLRAAYNSARPRGSPTAPPVEEWQGMSSICEDITCRAMDKLIASDRVSVFSSPADGIFSTESADVTGEELFGLEGQSQSGPSAANAAPIQEALIPAPCSPGSSETGSDLCRTCESGGSCGAGNGGTEHCIKSTGVTVTPTASATSHFLSETELDEEHDASSDIDVGHDGSGVEFSISGAVAAPHEALLMMPEGFNEGAVGEIEDRDIAAADWLDIAQALLDAVNESPEGFNEGAVEEMEDRDIAAADWLDVTHALLDAVNESGQGCC